MIANYQERPKVSTFRAKLSASITVLRSRSFLVITGKTAGGEQKIQTNIETPAQQHQLLTALAKSLDDHFAITPPACTCTDGKCSV